MLCPDQRLRVSFFRALLLICEKRKVLDSDGKINCTNCVNKINNKNNIDNSEQAWYIIQAVAWDKTGKCLRAHGNAKKINEISCWQMSIEMIF